MKVKLNQVQIFTDRTARVRAHISRTKKRMNCVQIRNCARTLGISSAAIVDCLNRIAREKAIS